jgi:uncharacterized protein (TIGR01244 family)
MRRPSLLVFALFAVALNAAGAQQFTRPGSIKLSAPVLLDTTEMFRARFAKLGEDVFIGGQPTEKALRDLKAQGVTTVVNLRSPQEMQSAVKFDEEALVKQLGMRYVYIPMRGTPELPYSPAGLDKFAEAMKTADGKVLLHCTIAWRASHMWSAYLIRERGIPVEDALANGRAINLMDTMGMGANGRQPVEEVLDRSLPSIGKPPYGT